jgi:parallel beta-helix repeat protein
MNTHQAVAVAFLFVFLCSAVLSSSLINFAEGNYVPWVWHNSRVYIQSDGSVEPSTAPIERSGNIYKFTNDVFSGIAVQKNDVVIDGNGRKILGNYYGTGLLLQNVSNIVVQNVAVQYFSQGIYLDNCNNSAIKGNTVYGADIEVYQSFGNEIAENSVGRDISIDFSDRNNLTSNNASSISLSWSTNIQIINNRIKDASRTGVQLSNLNFTEGIYIDNSDNCQISDNTIENKNVGIDIWQSTNLNLTKNSLADNQVGFKLWGSDLWHYNQYLDVTNTVNGNPVYFLVNKSNYVVPNDAGWIATINCRDITVRNWRSMPNWDGILFVNTVDSSIVNCTISGNYNGVRFDNVTDIDLSQNILSDNQIAVRFERTENSTVTDNQILNNDRLFEIWHESKNNSVVNNDFVGNNTGYIEKDDRNSWDNGAEGNFWSMFTGVDFNHDGISDLPYNIDFDTNATDNFPLMLPRNRQLTFALKNQTSLEGFLSMPIEYINYTITESTGTFWAEVHGVYPMHLLVQNGSDLPMVYPIPPNTTEIHLLMDGTELNWSNYSNIEPSAKHQTDIGNWQMISSTIKSPPSDFLIEISYKHPIQVINGSYMFLYDLNISPYLSELNTKSMAKFAVQLQSLPANVTGLSVFTTSSEKGWIPVNSTLNKSSEGIIYAFNIGSEYGQNLPGDIAMVLGDFSIPEFPVWTILSLLIASIVGLAALYSKKK